MRDSNVTIAEARIFTTQGGRPTAKRLLRVKAAADYLSVSPWKLRQLIQCGRLPVVQDGDGSPFLLDVRDLDGYVERSKRVTIL
jgi:excisionase family DNA binding protein